MAIFLTRNVFIREGPHSHLICRIPSRWDGQPPCSLPFNTNGCPENNDDSIQDGTQEARLFVRLFVSADTLLMARQWNAGGTLWCWWLRFILHGTPICEFITSTTMQPFCMNLHVLESVATVQLCTPDFGAPAVHLSRERRPRQAPDIRYATSSNLLQAQQGLTSRRRGR